MDLQAFEILDVQGMLTDQRKHIQMLHKHNSIEIFLSNMVVEVKLFFKTLK
ncbi:Uncharacterized protein BN1224_CV14_A_07120 [Chlamydia pneumoniae]|uniref:Uncharacterized protein n=2 Tax=Chlamydia pneumoniae TaxID=83558 RepID=A0A0F7XAX5_CHLPN|nr:hypothetical protein CPn_0685 [Chlamydia pneumoniae CWL029]ETR80599.1 hypothetical protein X556_0071 [Chlamydia pneumoniae B21]CRI33203.1 Uncharacterized protein BN1224_Wien1_A_07100 [Chlamydia pneumoniae]BAA98892.1 hypothetical protein [Chlamydia pneumoniae J138]CRI36066.1 Uncharacterized protein BN1224_CM1_A_07130 [Chlamydia pneumoniae]